MTVLRTPNKISDLLTGTLSLPSSPDTLVGRTSTDTLTNKTVESGVFSSPKEKWTIIGSAIDTSVNIDIKDGSAFLFTLNPLSNWEFNIRGDSSTTLSSMLSEGQSITIAIAVPQTGTAYYSNSFRIDSQPITPKWLGQAPSSGNASATDIYTYAIIKVDNTPTYSVFASQSKYV